MKRNKIGFTRLLNAFLAILLGGISLAVSAPAFAQDEQPSDLPSAAYPPPEYAPQPPPNANLPAYAPPQDEPAFRRGFLAMPFIGFHVPVGKSSDSLNSGLRLGTLLGGHVTPLLSLNGEFTIDVLNPKISGIDVTAVEVDLAFSPLFHFANGGLEIVVGPKMGVFGLAATTKNSSGTKLSDSSGNGLSYGANIGVFGGVGNLALGGLVGFTGRRLTKSCTTLSGQSERCYDSPGGTDLKVLSFTGAVLF
jgi:hypothetical protein